MLRYWWAKKAIVMMVAGSCSLWSQAAIAESVIEKIARTGKFSAGTSKDALPFAYRNGEGELVGYSIDILQLITQQLETELNRDLELELTALEPKERIPQLQQGKVDIVCDASSFTWERDRLVDFSVSYNSTGTRLLTLKGQNFWDAESLVGKRVGALAQTTNEKAIRRAQPAAEIVIYPDREQAYQGLRKGEIDAFASDGILLESWLRTINDPEQFQIVGDFSHEGIACMVAENNSDLLNTVNYAIVEFMQGYLEDKPEYVTIFERWFGSQGVLPLTQDQKTITIDNMLLLLDFTDRI